VNSAAYKLLGLAVWNGGRWYLRRRVAVRPAALKGVAAVGTLAGAALLARRVAG
jgi:hypothetical protein